MNVFQLIFSDYKKYKKYGGNFISIVFFTQGFWAIFQYRFAHFFFTKVRVPVIRHFLQLLFMIGQKCIEMTTGISIPASAKIGHSFYIGHFGGIILNSKSIIGNNCNISQGVTIGVSGTNEKRGVPIVRNNVYIGANAVIAGKIIVEDNAVIGACSLVTSNVASGNIMSGVPAVCVSTKGSEGYI